MSLNLVVRKKGATEGWHVGAAHSISKKKFIKTLKL